MEISESLELLINSRTLANENVLDLDLDAMLVYSFLPDLDLLQEDASAHDPLSPATLSF